MKQAPRPSAPAALSACIALAVVALLVAHVAPAFAQSGDVSAPLVTLTPATATVGDRLSYTITIEHADNVRFVDPAYQLRTGDLELVSLTPPRIESGAPGRLRTVFSYQLAAFVTGQQSVPGQTLSYNAPSGAGTVSVPPATVTIRSVLQPGDTELAPLKPQLEIRTASAVGALGILFMLAFAALTTASYALQQRAVAIRPPVLAATPSAAPPTAAERARAELAALAASGIAGGEPPEYYARLAAIVRRYLTERYGFPAYAMTRRELERYMTAPDLERWPARVTANLLEQCDAAEFARFVPAPERRDADLTAAYEVISLTSGPPAPADAPSSGAGPGER